jgi:L-fuconolactonase
MAHVEDGMTWPHIPVRPDWLATTIEPVIDPFLPIIDPHHHLWDRPECPYPAADFLTDLRTEHRILATIYVEAHAKYWDDVEPLSRPLGEIAFAASVGERHGSGGGEPAICAGIVGTIDLQAGDPVRGLLERAVTIGNGRLRGIRLSSAHHPNPMARASVFNAPPGLLGSPAFRAGFAHLAPLGLAFDAWMSRSS